MKEQQMRIEGSQAKRESKLYMANVDKGKKIESIIRRKRIHGATEEEVRRK